jgi:surfactin synthase thioesterase subunit
MNSSKWIVVAKPRERAAARLFCFSHAGAGGSAYRGWSDAAPAELEICMIQLPGRESRLREPALTSLAEIVQPIVKALEPRTDVPFAFFGHSMGALVAFETARELRRVGGGSPVALFVSASRAPQLPWPHPPVRHLTDVELLTEVNRRYESVPDVIIQDAELRELLTPALRADMTLVETHAYQPENPFGFPVVAFGGDADRMVKRPELEQWRAHTADSFRLRMLSGDHLFLQARRQELLADIVETMGLHADQLVTPSAR